MKGESCVNTTIQSRRPALRCAAALLALLLCLSGLVPQAEAEGTAPQKTEWQIRFAEHFTDEIVVTDHSYSSPNVSITITTYRETIDGYPQVWYVADIYVASLDCFRCFAHDDSFDRYTKMAADDLAREANALLGINGDYCNAQRNSAFYVRNGVIYQKDPTSCDLCVLYNDGTMETYGKNGYKVSEVVKRGPWHVWKFGPRLLDANGKARTSFNTTGRIKIGNPRSAFGYYEPGHYCFVVVDGRQKSWSRGLTLKQLAELFEDLGCKAAYNLDGGASATMTFMGDVINRQSSDRKIGDILMICEPQAQ